MKILQKIAKKRNVPVYALLAQAGTNVIAFDFFSVALGRDGDALDFNQRILGQLGDLYAAAGGK